MNLSCADQIAKAVLYEGYMLYPYRPSSVKNRQRWNFGVLYPQTYSGAHEGDEPCSMRTECLIHGNEGTSLEVKLRFLHLRTLRGREGEAGSLPDGWQEAVEREVRLPVSLLGRLIAEPERHAFAFQPETHVSLEPDGSAEGRSNGEREQVEIRGIVDVTLVGVRDDIFKVCVFVRNTSPLDSLEASRDEALLQSLVSTHTILGVEGGEFVSLLEPPADLQELAARCRNIGAWPVLVGEEGQRNTVLASPIILYDYPQIAPESPGDLFDGTEIDEILSLRIMTLTDEEKLEIRQSDDRARQILERTEAMPAEQFMKLHGAMRGLSSRKERTP
jgi:hypothetical protein